MKKLTAVRVKLICLAFLCMMSLLGWHSGAQNTPVLCYDDGSAKCSGNGTSVSYADCCSLANNNTDVYYMYDGQCRLCGPVIIDAFPEAVVTSSLSLQWIINSNSLPATLLRIVSEEEGSTVPVFPNIIDGSVRRHSFLGLIVGETYVFEILARAGNDTISLPYRVRWEAGKSELPTFDNFIQTSSNTTAGTASWILSCYGYRPMVQMTVQWREELDEDDTAGQTDPLSFPAGNIAIFNFEDGSPSNGMTFTHTFVNLLPDTRYAILIRGRNELGTSNTFFIIETEPSPQGPSQGALNHAFSVTSSPIVMFLSAVALLSSLHIS